MLVAGGTGCGSDSGPAAPEPVVDLAQLDVGGFATQPKRFEPKDRRMVGRYFEAEALGGVVPLTVEMDPSLKVNRQEVVHAFIEPGESHLSPMFYYLPTTGFDSDAAGFVAGFTSTGQSETDWHIGNSMSVSVLLFETEGQAAAAAKALSARGFYNNPDRPAEILPVKSSKYPDVIFSFRTDVKAVAGWYATGKYVIVPVAESPEDAQLNVSAPEKLLSLVESAIRVVSERVRNFTPTPVDQFSQRNLDPDDMLFRTLPRAAGDSYKQPPGVYDATTDLHFAEFPDRTRAMYDRAGVDRIGYGATQVVRARDAAAADGYLAEVTIDKYMVDVEAPKGLPGARCRKYRGPEQNAVPYYCYAAYDRYVGFASASQLGEAQQRISAQYAILANSK